MTNSTRNPALHVTALLLLLLTACNGVDITSSFGNPLTPIELPDEVEPYPDNQVLQVAKAQFAQGNFGHAARYYERAVELTPQNGEAWLGLAASYDQVRRFDLADRAYREAGRYLGHRAEYYNGMGYSYMLRGELAKAHGQFLKAQEIDPSNPTIGNNLQMLRDALAQARQG
ncbi:tetratricopeptide repeat protein [Microvirga sp. M2]|uniref:tetratricopeptide repeat protein n=1 Tax=Microvirga sp. M2 TaxID=3073270 RepID=UPI0039C44D5D